MKLEYSNRAGKAISRLDSSTKKRIRAALEALPNGDVKPLRGSPGTYRLRVGDYRVIFQYIGSDVILVSKVGPRGEIYKGV